MSEHVYKMVDGGFEAVADWMEQGIRRGWPELDSKGRKSCCVGIQLSRLDIEQRYMIVESDVAMDDVYVAIVGTKSLQDAYVDGRIQKKRVSGSLPGYAHAGFLSRSFKVPVRELYDMVVKRKRKRLVLCGHSLGGALAALCVVRLLDSLNDVDLSRIRCVTFGCPGVCDDDLASYVDRQGWSDVIKNIVVEDDPVVVLSARQNLPGYAYTLLGKTLVLASSSSKRQGILLNPEYHTMAYYSRRLWNNSNYSNNNEVEVVVEQRVIVPRVMLSMVTGFSIGSEYVLDVQGENLEWVRSVVISDALHKNTCGIATDFATYRYPIRHWRPRLWVVGLHNTSTNPTAAVAVDGEASMCCMTYEECRSRLQRKKKKKKKKRSNVSPDMDGVVFLLGKDDVSNTNSHHELYTLCSGTLQRYHVYAYDVHLSRDEVLKLATLTGASCIHDASVDSMSTVLKRMAHEALRAKRVQMMTNKSSLSLSSKL